MSPLSDLFRKITYTLTAEDEHRIRSLIRQSGQDLIDYSSDYLSQEKMDEIQSVWAQRMDEIRSIPVPAKHPLYREIESFENRFSNLSRELRHLKEQSLTEESRRLDPLFSDIDGKSLDDPQRRVVLSDEGRTLVLAGAGSGKTLTIAGKVKYLCEEKKVDPKEILLIAFTRKSAEEMTNRIKGKLSIPVEATTFHKLGLDILTEHTGRRPEVSEEEETFVTEYFNKQLPENPKQIKKLMRFFSFYLQIPPDLERFDSLGEAYEYEKHSDLETLKSKYDEGRYLAKAKAVSKDKMKTLQNEKVKSLDEVTIANYLFLNGIQYEYERPYPFKSPDASHGAYHPDFYLPEYDLYLEHFGINKDGKLPWLSPIEEKKYLEEMKWKRSFHKEHNTILLETYSYLSSEGRLLEVLEKKLKKKGVTFKEPDFSDLFHRVYQSKSEKYLSEFIKLCTTFLVLFKSGGYTEEALEHFANQGGILSKQFHKKRRDLFLEIMSPIIKAYNRHLEEKGAIDFSDMILKATKIVESGGSVKPYRWIIIDEFQDISRSRYLLISALLKRTGAKLLCVGDDWQSIYRFAGSDLGLFTHFEEYFGKATTLRLERTYRNSQELIDIAGSFVTKNPEQLKKSLLSDRRLSYPVTFLYFQDSPFLTLQKALNKIIKEFGKEKSVLLLGRTTYDLELLKACSFLRVHHSGLCEYRLSPDTPIQFLTVHKAKGLEADNVILLNFEDATLGFPNKIADDPLLGLVLSRSEDYSFAEERRLLYVALTRTRNRIFILVNEKKPSAFLKDFEGLPSVFMLKNKQGREDVPVIACPHCKSGHLITRKNSSNNRYFLSCSNYPYCNYSIKELSVLQNPRICPACGGFLVKRRGTHGYFYGCTNYPLCEFTEKLRGKK